MNTTKWILGLLATLLALWSPLAADAAPRKRQADKLSENLPATVFSCKGYPNNRLDLVQYEHLDSHKSNGRFFWSYGDSGKGMAIELERTQPGLLTYRILRDEKLVTSGTVKATTLQFAMTAGGPFGVELHCVTARE